MLRSFQMPRWGSVHTLLLALATFAAGSGLTAVCPASTGRRGCRIGGRRSGTYMLALLASLATCGFAATAASAGDAAAQVEILPWKDGKQAVFLLAFDDGCKTHRTKVIPELIKRNIPGTFYPIAGNDGLFGKSDWAELVKNPNVVLGNHTYTHKDMPNAEHFEKEVVQAAERINATAPHLPKKRLVSFAKPGGVKYGVTKQQIADVLAKHDLVQRPRFHGWRYQIKTVEQMRAYVDKTIRDGQMGHMDFHGVGGDWLSTPWEVFTELLDLLEANRETLWLTDAISYHKYLTERTSAAVKPLPDQGDGRLRLDLTSKADAELYDMPLTLRAAAPAGWTRCRVTQGKTSTIVPVVGGAVTFDARPNRGEITLESAPADATDKSGDKS